MGAALRRPLGPQPRPQGQDAIGGLRKNVDAGPRKAPSSIHTQAWCKVRPCAPNNGKNLGLHQLPALLPTGCQQPSRRGPQSVFRTLGPCQCPFSSGSGGLASRHLWGTASPATLDLLHLFCLRTNLPNTGLLPLGSSAIVLRALCPTEVWLAPSHRARLPKGTPPQPGVGAPGPLISFVPDGRVQDASCCVLGRFEVAPPRKGG